MTKIAFPSDDGETISKHLGQAQYFQVVTLKNGQVLASERREKPSHSHGQHDPASGTHPGQAMLDGIADCQVLIAGGMGEPMVQRAVSKGFDVYLTGEETISSALRAFQRGDLVSDLKRVHRH